MRLPVPTEKQLWLKGVELDLGPDPVYGTLVLATQGTAPDIYEVRVSREVAMGARGHIGGLVWLEIGVISDGGAA